jgi:O-antigen ligase
MPSRVFEGALLAALLAILPIAVVIAAPALAPLAFGLAAAQFLYRAATERRVPRFDAAWLSLALLFAGWCWASALWSIVPDRTLRGALQMTGILIGALAVLALPVLPDEAARKVMRAMAVAFLAAAALIAFDTAEGYPLQRFLSNDAANAATKYNRGVAYAVLIAWPVLGSLWRDRAWGFLALLVVGLAAAVFLSLSLTAKIAAVAAVAALLASALAPRIAEPAIAAGTALFVAFSPVLLRAASNARDLLIPYLKQSGEARLEIWNYMTARALERPALGWGLWSAGELPIRPRELAGYAWVHAPGLYPHDQWLQLWVETGALGAGMGIACILLALKRARELPAELRPFAFAAFAAAMTISLADFDLATDSWWAALAVCAYLFKTAASAAPTGRGGC